MGTLKRGLIRAQEVAQRWNTASIDVDHLASALAEGDDAVSQLLHVGFAHLRLSSAHLALGILEPSDAPPLRAGADLAELRTALDALAETGSVNPSG